MIDVNWVRWVHASVADYFKQVANTLQLKIIVEGLDERQSEKMGVDHAELRINGPMVFQLSHNFFRLDVDTNVLLTDLMGGADEDPFDLQRWTGAFQQAAWKNIPVYCYGPDTDGVDDGSFLGCLVPRGRKEAAKAFQFGQVSINDRVRQAAVDTRHAMELTVE